MGNCCLKSKDDQSGLLQSSSISHSNLSNIDNNAVVFVDPNRSKISTRCSTDLNVNCERTYTPGYHKPDEQANAFKVELPVIVYKHADFTFLVDHHTAKWIASDRVIFIMRGLPGSGKSTIADIMSHKFPQLIVCSFDKYFTENSTASRNSSEDMRAAESQCQTTFYNSCSNGKSPIVIDNEHIQSWEFNYYTNLAQKFNYLTVMVHPKTPWRFDIEVLAARNPRQLTILHIEDKLKQFEMDYPLYHGWFLSQKDSESLREFSYGILNLLNYMPDFRDQFFTTKAGQNLTQIFAPPKSRPHVTAFFCQKGKSPTSREYSDSAQVKDNIGSLFPLTIKSLFFTPRTFGARVELTEEAMRLLKIEDNEIVHNNFGLHPKLPRPVGCRAHITLGCAERVAAVQTGRDLLVIVDKEREFGDGGCVEQQWTAQLEAGCVTELMSQIFVIELNKPLQYEALFVGHY